jgi:hypothetical protein
MDDSNDSKFRPGVHHLRAKDFVLGGDRTLEVERLRAELKASKPKRQRKATLARALREAKKAGVSVQGATVEDGRVTLTFGEAATGDKINPWDTVLTHAANQKRPS